jgi:hypothetical protein
MFWYLVLYVCELLLICNHRIPEYRDLSFCLKMAALLNLFICSLLRFPLFFRIKEDNSEHTGTHIALNIYKGMLCRSFSLSLRNRWIKCTVSLTIQFQSQIHVFQSSPHTKCLQITSDSLACFLLRGSWELRICMYKCLSFNFLF